MSAKTAGFWAHRCGAKKLPWKMGGSMAVLPGWRRLQVAAG